MSRKPKSSDSLNSKLPIRYTYAEIICLILSDRRTDRQTETGDIFLPTRSRKRKSRKSANRLDYNISYAYVREVKIIM